MKKIIIIFLLALTLGSTSSLYAVEENGQTDATVVSDQEIISETNPSEAEVESSDAVVENTTVTTTDEVSYSITKSPVVTSRSNENIAILEGADSMPADISTSDAKASAGLETYSISSTGKSITSTLYITPEGLVSDVQVDGSNTITVTNGQVTEMDKGLVRTNGGATNTQVMYTSVEDAYNKTNPIPLSGGGFEGLYIDTITYQGSLYVNFLISGVSAYMPVGDVTLIPSNMVQAQSYYENINGEWVFNEAVDSLISTEYTTYPVGIAPEWAVADTPYYTYDNINYSTDPYNQSRATLSGATYYQNLPFRSTSNYTAANYKSYLSYTGNSASQYYNSTQAFVDAQNLEFVNSSLLFAFANHESAYGRSTYSYRCNNFFGLGAYDSNPDNACISYGYNTPRDGILAESIFLSTSYFDAYDWRYRGDYFGNKSGGMNVYYASDPNWGNANASHAYNFDKYMGSKEINMYKIGQISKDTTVYKNSSLSTPYKVSPASCGTSSACNFVLGGATTVTYKDNVIVRSEGSSSDQIQLVTPQNLTSSSTCKSSTAMKGSYPNYQDGGAGFTESASTGQISYACNYSSWSSQVGYVSKSAVSIINTGKGYVPGGHVYHNEYEYYPDGSVKYSYRVDENNVINYAYGYDANGKIINAYEYYPNTVFGHNQGAHIKYLYNIDSSGYITTAEQRTNNTRVVTNRYEYYSGAKFRNNQGSHIRYIYNIDSDGYISSAESRVNNTQAVIKEYEYYPKTIYGNNHLKHARYIYTIDSNGYISEAEQKTDISQNTINNYEYYPKTIFGNNQGAHINYLYTINSSGYIVSAEKRNNNGGQVTMQYEYYPNTKYGYNHGSHIKYVYAIDNGYITKAEQKSNNDQRTTYIYEYYPNTKFDDKRGTHIKYVYYMNSQNYINYAYQKTNNTQENYKKFYYKEHTTFPNRSAGLDYWIYV